MTETDEKTEINESIRGKMEKVRNLLGLDNDGNNYKVVAVLWPHLKKEEKENFSLEYIFEMWRNFIHLFKDGELERNILEWMIRKAVEEKMEKIHGIVSVEEGEEKRKKIIETTIEKLVVSKMSEKDKFPKLVFLYGISSFYKLEEPRKKIWGLLLQGFAPTVKNLFLLWRICKEGVEEREKLWERLKGEMEVLLE